MDGECVPFPSRVWRGAESPSRREVFSHSVRELLLLLQLSHPAAAHPSARGAPVLVLPSTEAAGAHQPAATGTAAPWGCASALVLRVGGNAQPQDFCFEAQMRCKHFLGRKTGKQKQARRGLL